MLLCELILNNFRDWLFGMANINACLDLLLRSSRDVNEPGHTLRGCNETPIAYGLRKLVLVNMTHSREQELELAVVTQVA